MAGRQGGPAAQAALHGKCSLSHPSGSKSSQSPPPKNHIPLLLSPDTTPS